MLKNESGICQISGLLHISFCGLTADDYQNDRLVIRNRSVIASDKITHKIPFLFFRMTLQNDAARIVERSSIYLENLCESQP